MNSVPPVQQQKRSGWSKAGRIILVIVGLWIVLAIIGRFSGNGSSSYHPTGGKAYLYTSSNRWVYVAASETACKVMEEALSDMDEEKLKGLLLSGLMFPADSHSEVVVLESGMSRAKIRVVSGNQTGEIGWVPVGFLSNN